MYCNMWYDICAYLYAELKSRTAYRWNLTHYYWIGLLVNFGHREPIA